MRFFILFLFCLALADSVDAGTLIGPTPYRSAADSPFDLSGLGTTFFLEDFEDGELNTLGVSEFGLPSRHGIVRGPSEITDSVDSDDGVLDGRGDDGHSLVAAGVTLDLSDPPLARMGFWFLFDSQMLGFSPTAAGFAWTDGGPNSVVEISTFDKNMELIERHFTHETEFGDIGDSVFTGETAEDRFIGVLEPLGMAAVRFTSLHVAQDLRFDFFELDHFQYGLAIPEPSTCCLALVAVLIAGLLTRRRDL